MNFKNAQFSLDYLHLKNGIILTIDNYTKTGERPCGIDRHGNPIWDDRSLTEIGSALRCYKYAKKDSNANWLAEILSEYIRNSKELCECTMLIACPSNKFSYIVELAASMLGIHSCDCLEKAEPFVMKSICLNKRADKAKSIKCYKPIDATEKVIIIDDIVESGATLQASKNALLLAQPSLKDIKMLAMTRTIWKG